MPDLPPDPPKSSQFILARGALMAGLCVFVPVPLLDGWLLRQANRHVIASLLSLHEKRMSAGHVFPLYGDSMGCLATIFWWLVMFPIRLVIDSIKKLFETLLFFLLIRRAALEVGRTYLLGRTAERCLLDGRLPDPGDRPGRGSPTWQAAGRARRTFERTFKNSDWRFLRQVIVGVLRGMTDLYGLGRDVARTTFKSRAANATVDDEVDRLDNAEQQQVATLTERLIEALGKREVEEYLKSFDERFDAAWERT